MDDQHFTYQDDRELWLRDIVERHYEEALSRAATLLTQTAEQENGC